MKRILLILAILLLLPTLAWAQDPTATPAAETPAPTTLSYMVPLEGEITTEVFSQTWDLPNVTADRVDVVVERLTGNLIPDISILDANGQFLATSFGAEEAGATAILENYTFPAAGNYRILIEREGAEGGSTTGTYSLTVVPRAVADENPGNTNLVGEITYGTPVQGDLTAVNWRDLHTLTVDAADRILVRAERLSGSLSPYIEVLDGNGSPIVTAFPNSTRDVTQTEASLAGAGEYTIAISRENGFNGETVGGYSLTVTLLGAGEGSAMLTTPVGTVTYDTPVEGEIAGGRWYQDWTLTTDAADALAITVERTGGNLQPEVILLGGSGQELTRGYANNTGEIAILENYGLDTPGTYTLRVARQGGIAGDSTGTYQLNLILNGSGEGSPALAPAESAIVTSEKVVTGEITNRRWGETWTFEALADQSYDLVVTRTSGTLYPRIAIQDANGQPIYDVYYEDTRDIALQTFTFPSAGTYRIVVFRDGGRDGITSGSYELSITPTPAQ